MSWGSGLRREVLELFDAAQSLARRARPPHWVMRYGVSWSVPVAPAESPNTRYRCAVCGLESTGAGLSHHEHRPRARKSTRKCRARVWRGTEEQKRELRSVGWF